MRLHTHVRRSYKFVSCYKFLETMSDPARKSRGCEQRRGDIKPARASQPGGQRPAGVGARAAGALAGQPRVEGLGPHPVGGRLEGDELAEAQAGQLGVSAHHGLYDYSYLFIFRLFL